MLSSRPYFEKSSTSRSKQQTLQDATMVQMLEYQTRVKVYVQILKNERDAKAVVKSSTSARLLSGARVVCNPLPLYARLKSLRPLTPPKMSISAVWARGQHCPARLTDSIMMRNRLSDRLRRLCEAVITEISVDVFIYDLAAYSKADLTSPRDWVRNPHDLQRQNGTIVTTLRGISSRHGQRSLYQAAEAFRSRFCIHIR